MKNTKNPDNFNFGLWSSQICVQTRKLLIINEYEHGSENNLYSKIQSKPHNERDRIIAGFILQSSSTFS